MVKVEVRLPNLQLKDCENKCLQREGFETKKQPCVFCWPSSFKFDNTILLVFENILELPLNANIQGTGVFIKKVLHYSRGSSWKKFDEDHCL